MINLNNSGFGATLPGSQALGNAQLSSKQATDIRLDTTLDKGDGRKLIVSAQSTTVNIQSSVSSGDTQKPLDLYAPSAVKEVSVDSRPQTDAAKNILGFISQRLGLDAADGDDTEALQSRLEAGLEGFIEGFEEARAQLEGLGQLNEGVSTEIDATYRQVLQGVSQLAQEYGLDDPASAQLAAIKEAKLSVDDLTSTINHASNLNGADASSSGFSAQSKTFEFSLTTAQGDIVLIKAAAAQVNAFDAQNGSRFTASSASSNEFLLEVDGDLNQEELSAINNLLADVTSLSNTFYSGNIEQAFNDALELDIDSDQIVNFALSLTYSNYTKVDSAFSGIAGLGETEKSSAVTPQSESSNQLAAMAEFVQQLEDIRLQGKTSSILADTLDKILQTSLGNDLDQPSKAVSSLLSSLEKRAQ